MMSRRNGFRGKFVLALRVSALLLPAGIAFAQSPANPSFSGTSDDDTDFHVFTGVYRVGGPGATYNFSVFNFALPGSSRMSLDSVVPLGDPAALQNFQMQTGTVTNLLPGGQAAMQVNLLTTNPSPAHAQSSAFYTLRFKSVDLPEQPLTTDIAISVYANIYRRGDYDIDGDVDNADYGIWRGSIGTTGTNLAADGNQNNVIDAGDYVIWRNDFTGPLGSGGGNSDNVALGIIPEPAAAATIALAATLVGLSGRRARRRPRFQL